MFSIRPIATAILATTYAVAAAQPLSSTTDPADPAAGSAPVAYQSAFATYQPMREDGESPDKVWRASNDAVAAARGHAGHGKKPAESALGATSSHLGMDHKEKTK